ncbi:S9 family peptidase [Fimbriimonadia bacterium ATM]|nr:MAG: S9 family peptidase [Armatimonadota bacterium]MBC6970587.1 S9 family peptidase [Armatimonadota bacterium]MCE7899452.1 S9 family peptidase [Armatimonadetes bacterium ATM1]MDL1929197.1 S9 family peptidase [Fimbriimonadia bacterium ATM]
MLTLRPRPNSVAAILLLVIAGSAAHANDAYRPTREQIAASYQRAEQIGIAARAAYKLQVTPNWIGGEGLFWYVNRLAEDRTEYWLIDPQNATKKPAFDSRRLADGLSTATGTTVDAAKLALEGLVFSQDLKAIDFEFANARWTCNLTTYELTRNGDVSRPAPGTGRGQRGGQRANESPDGKHVAVIAEGRLQIKTRDGATHYESQTDSMQFAIWSPDSKRLFCFRCTPGDRREVFLIQSSPPNGGRATLQRRLYDLPGDKLDTFEAFVIDVETKAEVKSDLEPVILGGQPFIGPPDLVWSRDGKTAFFDYVVRGYQQVKVVAIDLESGKSRVAIDERSETFVDTTAQILRYLPSSGEMIWRSERDGWGRLYRIDASNGAVKNAITPMGWVVRGIEWVDESAGRICFSANCTREGEDPYFIHFLTVGLDGKGLTRLTDGHGTHRVQFSPNRAYYVDTYSRVDSSPMHELRRTRDGSKLMTLEEADLSDWKKLGIPMPEPFVAKGRDGVTDIWGIVVRPSNFDPTKKYPIIENLYAGPQDSFTPKSFSPLQGMQRLAELGFIVVQCDGMGTRNRGKKFHDVCWKNLADAGFPDRILWMKALAQKYDYMDIERVGVYGTSAGGQSSTGALLFHPEFYKVAVSSCGCHDNRMDKYWWNEQWMGYPVGPHYEAQSNITNAAKLQGRLLLMVGELDTNVPPESTFRLVDALIKANKEFEFVVLPGQGHTSGGAFGERKRRDFFVRWLHGVEPPNWNEATGLSQQSPCDAA